MAPPDWSDEIFFRLTEKLSQQISIYKPMANLICHRVSTALSKRLSLTFWIEEKKSRSEQNQKKANSAQTLPKLGLSAYFFYRANSAHISPPLHIEIHLTTHHIPYKIIVKIGLMKGQPEYHLDSAKLIVLFFCEPYYWGYPLTARSLQISMG